MEPFYHIVDMTKIHVEVSNKILSVYMGKDRNKMFITLRLNVCIGRLRVSPMCLFFGSLGLLQNVCQAFKKLS